MVREGVAPIVSFGNATASRHRARHTVRRLRSAATSKKHGSDANAKRVTSYTRNLHQSSFCPRASVARCRAYWWRPLAARSISTALNRTSGYLFASAADPMTGNVAVLNGKNVRGARIHPRDLRGVRCWGAAGYNPYPSGYNTGGGGAVLCEHLRGAGGGGGGSSSIEPSATKFHTWRGWRTRRLMALAPSVGSEMRRAPLCCMKAKSDELEISQLSSDATKGLSIVPPQAGESTMRQIRSKRFRLLRPHRAERWRWVSLAPRRAIYVRGLSTTKCRVDLRPSDALRRAGGAVPRGVATRSRDV